MHKSNPQLVPPAPGFSLLHLTLLYLAKRGHFRCIVCNNTAVFELQALPNRSLRWPGRFCFLLTFHFNDRFKSVERFIVQVQSKLGRKNAPCQKSVHSRKYLSKCWTYYIGLDLYLYKFLFILSRKQVKLKATTWNMYFIKWGPTQRVLDTEGNAPFDAWPVTSMITRWTSVSGIHRNNGNTCISALCASLMCAIWVF